MANNYTAVANRLSGIPGRTAGSDDITVTINPLAGFRVFVEDFSINDPQGLFDSVTKIQSGQSVIFTLSLRSDVVFQATDSVLDIDIVGNAVSADEGDDIVIIGDIIIPDGNDDLDIIVTDEDGDPIGDNIIHIDVLGDMPGDEIIIGMLEINPKEGDEFPDGTEDIDIDDLFDWPKDEFGNDLYILRGPISDSDGGGFIYEIVIVVPNEDDMNLGDGMPVGIETVVILLDGSGNPIDQTINPITEIVEVPEITDININSDNIDPTGGGFIVITAQGDPGATGTVTITPMVTGSLPDGVTLEVITVDIVIDENGLFVETVRIPSAVGEQNIDPICRPVLPDDFEGIEWTVVAESDAVDEDGMPIVETDVMDPITQDEGTTICIEVSSLDPTVELPETIVLGPIPRGFTFPPGNGRFSIPAALGNQWTIINNDITPFISRTGSDTGITICNSRVDSTFDPLDIDFQYTSGTARGSKTTYNIDLDSIATLNTEVAIEFRIPDAFNFAFDLDSPASGRFAYAGVPNTAVPALDVASPANAPTYGGIPAYIDIRVDDPNGFTWEESDIMINSFTTITEDVPHITIDRIILPNGNAFNPQSVGNIPVLRVIWTVAGNFPTPVLGDIVDETILEFTEDATPITGVTFDLGVGNRGHATLIDSSFNNILPLTGPEGRAWTTRYAIQPDPGHVITNASIDVNSENIHNSADLDAATGVTISAPTLQSGELSGGLAGNFFSENYTVQPDFDADALAMGTARFTLDATGVSNSTSVLSPIESFPLIEGESVSATATIDSPITHGFLLSNRPTATVDGVDTMFMSRNPRVFNGETYYDWTLTTSHTFGDTPGQDVVIPIVASGTPVQLPVIYTIPVDITIDGFSHITVVGDGVTVDSNGDLVIVGDVPSTLNGVEITLHSLNGWGIDNVDDVDVNFGLVGSVTQTGVVLNGLPDNSVVDLDDNTITYTVNIVLPNNPGEEITDQTTVTQSAAATGLRPLVMLDVFLDEAVTMPLTERPVVRNFPATGGTETLYVRAIGQGLGTGWRTRRGIAGYQVSSGTQLDGVSPLVITNSATNTSPTVETVEILEIESRALSDVFIPFRLVQNVAPLILEVDTTEITFGPEVGSTNSITFTTNDRWILTGLEPSFTSDIVPDSDGLLVGEMGTHTVTFTTTGPYVDADIFDDLIISTRTTETSEGNAIVTLQRGVRLLQSNIVLMLRERGTTNVIDETIVFDSSTTSMPFDVFVNSFGVGAGGWTSSVSDFTITPSTGGEGITPIGIAPISANESIVDQVTGTAVFTSVSSSGVENNINLAQDVAAPFITGGTEVTLTPVEDTGVTEETYTFETNDRWTTSNTNSAFTITPANGDSGTNTITISNPTGPSRTAISSTLTITTVTDRTSGGATITPDDHDVTITQAAFVETFSVETRDGTIPSLPIVGGTLIINVDSNIDGWTVPATAGPFTLVKISDTQLSITAVDRTGIAGGLTETFNVTGPLGTTFPLTVTQIGEPVTLIASVESFNAPNTGGNGVFDVQTNSATLVWEATSSNTGLVNISPSSGTGPTTGVRITIEPNGPGQPEQIVMITLRATGAPDEVILVTVAAGRVETLTLSSPNSEIAIDSDGNALVSVPLGGTGTGLLTLNIDDGPNEDWSSIVLDENGNQTNVPGATQLLTIGFGGGVFRGTIQNPGTSDRILFGSNAVGSNLNIGANTTFEEISTTLSTSTNAGSVTRNITFTQPGMVRSYALATILTTGHTLTRTDDNYMYSPVDNTRETEAQRAFVISNDSSLTWSASTNDDWIRFVAPFDGETPQDYENEAVGSTTGADGNVQLNWKWDAQETGAEARTGTITITYSDGHVITISIPQAAGAVPVGQIHVQSALGGPGDGANRSGTLIGPARSRSGAFTVNNVNAPWIVEAPEGFRFSEYNDNDISTATLSSRVTGEIIGTTFSAARTRVWADAVTVGDDVNFTLELRARGSDGEPIAGAAGLLDTLSFTQLETPAPTVPRSVLTGPRNVNREGSLNTFPYSSSELVTITSNDDRVYFARITDTVSVGSGFTTPMTTIEGPAANNVMIQILPVLDNASENAVTLRGTITVTGTSGAASSFEYVILPRIAQIKAMPGPYMIMGTYPGADVFGEPLANHMHPCDGNGNLIPLTYTGIGGNVSTRTVSGITVGGFSDSGEYFGDDQNLHIACNESNELPSPLNLRDYSYMDWQMWSYTGTAASENGIEATSSDPHVTWLNDNDADFPLPGATGASSITPSQTQLGLLNIGTKGSRANDAGSGVTVNEGGTKLGNTRTGFETSRDPIFPDAAIAESTSYSHNYTNLSREFGNPIRIDNVNFNGSPLRTNGRLIARLLFSQPTLRSQGVVKNIYYYDQASIDAAKNGS